MFRVHTISNRRVALLDRRNQTRIVLSDLVAK